MALIDQVPRHNLRFMNFNDQYPIPIQKVSAINKSRGFNTAYFNSINTNIPNMSTHPSKSFNCSIDINSKHNRFDPNAAIIDPRQLELVPKVEWFPQPLSLKDMQTSYFSKRNGAARQFDFKLYNALCITKAFPESYKYIGVIWVDENTFKVNAEKLTKFFNFTTAESLIFHKQGVFRTHGFAIIENGQEICPEIDNINERLLYDSQKRFSMSKGFQSADTTYNSGG